MPRGITQCYLPPGRGDISALTPGEICYGNVVDVAAELIGPFGTRTTFPADDRQDAILCLLVLPFSAETLLL